MSATNRDARERIAELEREVKDLRSALNAAMTIADLEARLMAAHKSNLDRIVAVEKEIVKLKDDGKLADKNIDKLFREDNRIIKAHNDMAARLNATSGRRWWHRIPF